MKWKLLLIATTCFFVTSAQRTVRVEFDGIYDILFRLSRNWSFRGTDIIIGSKPSLTLVRVKGNNIIEQKEVSLADFIKSVEDSLDIPLYDSTGEMIGKRKTKYFHSVNAAIVSTSPLLSNKIGFRFANDAENKEKKYDYFFLNPFELNALKKPEMKLILELFRLNTLSNKEYYREDLFTKKGGKETFGFFPLNGSPLDSPAIKNMANMLIDQYNSDFIKTHYLKDMRSYHISSDDYYNTYIKDTTAYYDTLLISEPTTTSTELVINRKFSSPPNIGVTLYLDRMLDAKDGLKYAGIPYPCITSTGFYLGDLDVFLERTDRKKYFSPSSWIFEQLVLGFYN